MTTNIDESVPLPKDVQLGFGAWIRHIPAALPAVGFDALWEFGMSSVPPTPNPFNGGRTNLKRRQATFIERSPGLGYRFSGKRTHALRADDLRAFELFAAVEEDFAMRHPTMSIDELRKNVMYHFNWYPGGAGISPHKDDEAQLEAGADIYSYSFMNDESYTRNFQVYHEDDSTATLTVPLGSGDLLVMGGSRCQVDWKHGVKTSAAKRYAKMKRINITVRWLNSEL